MIDWLDELRLTDFTIIGALMFCVVGFSIFFVSGSGSGLIVAGIGLSILGIRTESPVRYSGFIGVFLILVGIVLSLRG